MEEVYNLQTGDVNLPVFAGLVVLFWLWGSIFA